MPQRFWLGVVGAHKFHAVSALKFKLERLNDIFFTRVRPCFSIVFNDLLGVSELCFNTKNFNPSGKLRFYMFHKSALCATARSLQHVYLLCGSVYRLRKPRIREDQPARKALLAQEKDLSQSCSKAGAKSQARAADFAAHCKGARSNACGGCGEPIFPRVFQILRVYKGDLQCFFGCAGYRRRR